MMDYNTYEFTKEEYIKTLLQCMGVTSVFAFLFYKSIIVVILTLPFSLYLMKQQKKKRIKQRYDQMNVEFKEAIISISAALNGGYSMENAIGQAVKDLELIVTKESYMLEELKYMQQQVTMSKTVEQVFMEFAERVELEDVHNFVEVFRTAKRTGGNIIKVIKSTTKSITDKMEVRREIETLITAKKMEANIMCAVPLLIIVYMWISSPGYLEPLYGNVVGMFIMTILLGVYLTAYTMTQRITTIEV